VSKTRTKKLIKVQENELAMKSLSRVRITKIINRSLDKIEKTDDVFLEDNVDLFSTQFGKKYQTNLKKLIGFVTMINILTVLISNYASVMKDLAVKENIALLKANILEEIKGNNDLEGDYWVSIVTNTSEEDIYRLVESFTKGKQKTNEKDLLSREGIQESKLLSHLVAYFILRLFAFTDAFTQDLYNFIRDSISNKERLYEIIEYYNKSKKLNERIKNLLLVTDKELKIPNIIDELFKEKNRKCYEDKAALGIIIQIRNKIAHGYYLPEVEELQEQFKYINKNSKIRLERTSNKFLDLFPKFHEFILKYMQDSSNRIISDLEFMMFLIELGMACMRYMSIIEKIMLEYY